MRTSFGALAQLGERNTGSVEVSGSIPLGSTKITKKPASIDAGFFVSSVWFLSSRFFVKCHSVMPAHEPVSKIFYWELAATI